MREQDYDNGSNIKSNLFWFTKKNFRYKKSGFFCTMSFV